MDNHEKNCIVYQKAIEYLFAHSHGLTQEILDTYMDDERKTTMNDVFRVAVFSFRDWNPQFGKSGIKEHPEKIASLFKDFDVRYFLENIISLPDDKLDELFKNAFGGSNNAYKKVKENVCCTAKYLMKFKDVNEMYDYFDGFDSTKENERIKLIKSIDKDVKWWGTALVANWLKDIGMSNYSKPDDHVTYIVSKLDYPSNNDHEVITSVYNIALDYKKIDDQASAFKLDRLFWLIGSGNFYNHKGIVTYDGNRDDFIRFVKSFLK